MKTVADRSDADDLVSAMLTRPDSPFRLALDEEQRAIWDQVSRKQIQIQTQYWSDGLIRFACLGGDNVPSSVNSIYEIINFSGVLCFLGLAQHRPVRGAIEGAWGSEIREGQLYGAVVSNAYELESEVAQYPRIIVGHRIVELLEEVRSVQSNDLLSRLNQSLAERCLKLLIQDVDGHWIIHYLGPDFRFGATHENHPLFFEKALNFIVAEMEKHKEAKNSKLAFRYSQLLAYFEAFPAK